MKTPIRVFFESQIRKVLRIFLALIDPGPRDKVPSGPKRILLLNGAHLGDIVISTSLLPVLKSVYPQAEIGFATASWSHAVVRNHPLVTYTHCIDASRLNRAEASWLKKLLRSWRTRRQALKEIRSLSYDMAICLHPWRPDFLFLAWQAAIPQRVAFSRSLWAPLATVVADYAEDYRLVHQGECQAQLLRALGIGDEPLRLRKASLASSTASSIAEVADLLGDEIVSQKSYCIIHMGSGARAKEVPLPFWRDLAERLSATQKVLFTGRGEREFAHIAQVSQGLPNCVNACGKLSWDGFVAAVRHAAVLFGSDSTASHVAGAVATPCSIMFGGMHNIARWRPEGDNCTIWSNPVPCHPCGRFYGCATMTCMQGFVAADVLAMSELTQGEARSAPLVNLSHT